MNKQQLGSVRSPRRSRRFWLIAMVVAVLVAVAAAFWGPVGTTRWAARKVDESLAKGAVGAAESWIDWGRRFNAADHRLDLMQAMCYRHLGHRDAWQASMDEAQIKQSGAPEILDESKLADYRWGIIKSISADDIRKLESRGVPSSQAVTVVVQGMLTQARAAQAEKLVRNWQADAGDSAQTAFLLGLCLWSQEKQTAAQAEFQRTIELGPEHEAARESLGKVLEQQELIGAALPHYAYLLDVAGARESVQVDLARVLRKLGRLAEAESVLPTPAGDQASQTVALEIAEREYALGNYKTALEWFERCDLEGAHLAETLRTAASAMAYSGDYLAAQQLFTRVDQAQADSRHASELRRRLSIDPNDPTAGVDLQQMLQPSQAVTQADALPLEHSSLLYETECSACHGLDGGGNGQAGRFLFPRPRNFLSERMRLVSTQNAIASRENIGLAIRQGIPGTSMPAFAEFNDSQMDELVELVQRFARAGIRSRLSSHAGDWGPLDEDEIDRLVEARTTAGEAVEVPAIGEPTPESISAGREAFEQFGCSRCHAADGSHPAEVALYDESGRPALARDIAIDPLKGGDSPQSLFLRIRLGMPGTPHPGLPGISDAQLIELVQYCRSVALAPDQESSNQLRAYRASLRLGD